MTAGLAERDLRTTLLGIAAWTGALLGLGLPRPWLFATVSTAVVVALVLWRSRRTAAAILVVASALAGAAALRVEATSGSSVAALATARSTVSTVLVLRTDPVRREGRYGDYVVVEATTRSVTARGHRSDSSVSVLVLADVSWAELRLGSVVAGGGRLAPAETAEHAAVLSARGDFELLNGPSRTQRAADHVRASVRRAAAGGPEDASQLVPALVTGDDQRLADEVADDFRTAGLTHLTAVSGTNLTLVLAFVLLTARWCGVRGRGLLVVGLVGVVGFVIVARPEPSVVRAAAMGTVALLGLGAGGRAAGVRALGAAVLLLLVYDPWLARSPGFALSVLATGGILLVAPPCRDALSRWLPRWLAEAVAVPLAAQLACTPVVAALSGEVSLVAVAANLVVAPAVAPATLLGLAGGLVGLVLPTAGGVLGWLAAWCAHLIVVTAHHAAAMPVAAIRWATHPAALAALVGLTALLTLAAPALLRHPRLTAAVTLVLALVVTRPLPGLGWPPPDWVLVMCDVGQGDALVVATGPHEAVVVDAGPDPPLVDRCLRRLDVHRVPAVVLTHFHADHIDGLAGVLRDRPVGEVQVTGLREPADGVRKVTALAREARVPVRVPAYGEVVAAGDASWTVVGPRRISAGSPNDASVVLMVEVRGLRVLLSGDVEPAAQGRLSREELAPVDVLKVPHHGSSYQDEPFLTRLAPRLALVSVGADNDYGHPDSRLLDTLQDSGAVIRRTDRDGDVAVVVADDELRAVTSR